MSARSLLRATSSTSNPSDNHSDPSNPLAQDPLISIHPKTKSIRCIPCDYQVIKHLSLWSSHCQSKPHRQALATLRQKEEQDRRKKAQQEEEEQQQEIEKIRLEELEKSNTEQQKEKESSKNGKGKRKAEEDEDGDQNDEAKKSKSNPNNQDQDEEWLAFQREVLGNDNHGPAGSDSNSNAIQPLYNHATVISEPQLNVKPKNPERGEGDGEPDGDGEGDGEQEETAEEKRKRLDREEKEEIYQRYMEEIRNQDEVDER